MSIPFLVGRVYGVRNIASQRVAASNQPTTVVDLDGTLMWKSFSSSGVPAHYELRPNLIEDLTRLRRGGERLVLWTSAAKKYVEGFFAKHLNLVPFFDTVITRENYKDPQDDDIRNYRSQNLLTDSRSLRFRLIAGGDTLKDPLLIGARAYVDDSGYMIERVQKGPLGAIATFYINGSDHTLPLSPIVDEILKLSDRTPDAWADCVYGNRGAIRFLSAALEEREESKTVLWKGPLRDKIDRIYHQYKNEPYPASIRSPSDFKDFIFTGLKYGTLSPACAFRIFHLLESYFMRRTASRHLYENILNTLDLTLEETDKVLNTLQALDVFPHDRVLVLGAGKTALQCALAARAGSIIVVDKDVEVRRWVSAKFNSLNIGDSNPYRFHSQPFLNDIGNVEVDLVTAVSILDLMQHSKEVYKKLLTSLSPGGRILLGHYDEVESLTQLALCLLYAREMKINVHVSCPDEFKAFSEGGGRAKHFYIVRQCFDNESGSNGDDYLNTLQISTIIQALRKAEIYKDE